MRETEIMMRGTVITDPVSRALTDGGQVTSFRLVSRPRYFDRRTQSWVDGEATYATINCWRGLALNASTCVMKRDRVVVVGRLRTPQWKDEHGANHTSVVIEADTVGHDLNFGTASFRWGSASTVAEDPARETADELLRTTHTDDVVDLDRLLAPPSAEEARERADRAFIPGQAAGRPGHGNGDGDSDPDADLDSDLEDDELDAADDDLEALAELAEPVGR